MKIVFPEINNPVIQQALTLLSKNPTLSYIEPLPADDLASACATLKQGIADAMVAGIDHSTRDVILACRDHLGTTSKTFSASMYLRRPDTSPSASAPSSPTTSSQPASSAPSPTTSPSAPTAGSALSSAPNTVASAYIVADCAACKNPTAEQLFDICEQTFTTAQQLFSTPRLALLSFSTLGSGGYDDSITKIQAVVARLREERPDILADGELQLDCAIDPTVATKKAPDSPVAGQANVLICPDLNSGNILYKSLERFGGYIAAGPLLQGFAAPVSDLSRGSTAEDVLLTIETLSKLCTEK